jgi:hypothetical protein
MPTFTAFGAVLVPITGHAMDWKSRWLDFAVQVVGESRSDLTQKARPAARWTQMQLESHFESSTTSKALIPWSLVPLSGHQTGNYCH